jgi:4-hydroxybenzoate polyprenyltransferase
MAAALKLSPKPGSAFTLILVYSIIGQVFFFNPIWFARSIIAALAIEAFYLSSKRGTVSSLTLMGLMFGILYSVTGIIFQIYTWGYWQPLFVTLPEAVMAGVLMAVGSFLGFALGERAKTVMY